MVKKFIQGLIKGKQQKEEPPKEAPEAVPDELPPLAEDTAPAPAAEAKEAVSEDKKEEPPKEAPEAVPDELPAAEEQKAPEEHIKLQPKGEEAQGSAEEAPEDAGESGGGGEAESGEEVAGQEKDEGGKEEAEKEGEKEEGVTHEEVTQTESAEETTEQKEGKQPPHDAADQSPGFFSNIINHIKKHGVVKEKLLSGDLFSRMSNYYDLRKDEIRGGTAVSNEQKLERALVKELSALQELEQKWHTQKMALEEDLKFLHEREKDIQLKAEELRQLTNQIQLFKNVAPKNYFVLHNGVAIKNVRELIDAFEVMDEATFKHHTARGRNDFARWVKNVIKDERMAERLRQAKNKYEMISLLETKPLSDEDDQHKKKKGLHPKEYFWLTNGAVVKSLAELSDALRYLDDETFHHHVSKGKNDFSDWIEKVFHNKHLAHKLRQARSREEMIHLLEVFL